MIIGFKYGLCDTLALYCGSEFCLWTKQISKRDLAELMWERDAFALVISALAGKSCRKECPEPERICGGDGNFVSKT